MKEGIRFNVKSYRLGVFVVERVEIEEECGRAGLRESPLYYGYGITPDEGLIERERERGMCLFFHT